MVKNMALNFRLKFKSSEDDYTIINPETEVGAIDDTENVYQIISRNLTIPVPSQSTVTQTLSFLTDSKMPESKVEMYLVSTGSGALSSYSTITQFEVKTNQVIITRLGEMPTEQITVTLMFYEKRVVS